MNWYPWLESTFIMCPYFYCGHVLSISILGLWIFSLCHVIYKCKFWLFDIFLWLFPVLSSQHIRYFVIIMSHWTLVVLWISCENWKKIKQYNHRNIRCCSILGHPPTTHWPKLHWPMPTQWLDCPGQSYRDRTGQNWFVGTNGRD